MSGKPGKTQALTVADTSGGIYVGCRTTQEDAITVCELLRAAKIPAYINRGATTAYRGDYAAWCINVFNPRQRDDAREILRGFQAAMGIKGNPRTFARGVVAALEIRSGKSKSQSLPVTKQKLLSKPVTP